MSGYFPIVNYNPINPTNLINSENISGKKNFYGPIRNRENQFITTTFDRTLPFSPKPNSRTNIYVSGFPTNWSSTQLRSLFNTYGVVNEIKNITKKTHEENRGVAFIHFSKHSSALSAIDDLKDKIPNGCTAKLTVRFANANKNIQPEFLKLMRVSVSRDCSGWLLESSLNVYVCHIPKEITENEIKSAFEPFGKITSFKMKLKTEKNSIAFIHYESPEEAIKAVSNMDGFLFKNAKNNINVRFAIVNKSKVPQWFNIEHIKNMQTTSNVYVSQIPSDWKEKELYELFSKYGKISEIKLLSKKDTNGRVAFVHYENSISACKSVAFINDTKPEKDADLNILVTFARMDSITFDRLMKNSIYSNLTMANKGNYFGSNVSQLYPFNPCSSQYGGSVTTNNK